MIAWLFQLCKICLFVIYYFVFVLTNFPQDVRKATWSISFLKGVAESPEDGRLQPTNWSKRTTAEKSKLRDDDLLRMLDHLVVEFLPDIRNSKCKCINVDKQEPLPSRSPNRYIRQSSVESATLVRNRPSWDECKQIFMVKSQWGNDIKVSNKNPFLNARRCFGRTVNGVESDFSKIILTPYVMTNHIRNLDFTHTL